MTVGRLGFRFVTQPTKLKMNLSEYIQTKPLFYDKKILNFSQIQKAYTAIEGKFKKPPTLIHIVGTNGKGSTGRTIAHLSHKTGLNVGHYSSPHIFKYNERFWLNGTDAVDEKLEAAHQRLYPLVKDLETSYFEYTTLLSIVLFEDCDLVVCEAGLGGEFDATNVCKKDLSIITPIGLDHQAFLGNSIEEIATTKINSIETKAIISLQQNDIVYEIAKKIACKKNATLYFANNKYASNKYNKDRLERFSNYLKENISLALESLDILEIKYNINNLNDLEFFGRYYPLTENIRIDVGHNLLAAQVIFDEIKENTVLIYNSLNDKPYKDILNYLKPKLKRVEILKLENTQALKVTELEAVLKALGIKYKLFENIDNISAQENYLVFGSFFVVEEFLKRFNG